MCELKGTKLETLVDCVAAEVSKFSVSTLEELSQGQWGAVSDCLRKLRTWGDGFPERCRNLYDEVRSATEDMIKLLVDEAEAFSNFNIDTVEIAEIGDLCDVMRHLSCCHGHHADLVLHEIEGDQILRVWETLCANLRQSLLKWQDEVNSTMYPNQYTLKDLQGLAFRARALHSLQSQLGQDIVWANLGVVVASCYGDINGAIVQYYADCALQWTSTKRCLKVEAFGEISDLLEGANCFENMGTEWNSVQISANTVQATVHSSLSAKAKTIQSLSRDIKTSGIKNAEIAVQLTSELHAFIEFDKLFAREDQFVQNVFIAIRRSFSDRVKKIKKEVDSCFTELFGDRHDSISALMKLEEYAQEVKDVAVLAPILGEGKQVGLYGDMNLRLVRYLDEMGLRGDNCLTKWKDGLKASSSHPSLLEETRKLDDLLGQMAIIRSLNMDKGINDVAQTIADKIEDAGTSSLQRLNQNFRKPLISNYWCLICQQCRNSRTSATLVILYRRLKA